MTYAPEICACGCGERTTRRVRLLREQDRDTANALGWAELSVAPMRVPVALVDGHVIPEGYVDESEGCPCCGSPGRCECEIHTATYRVDLLTDDQGTVWGDETAEVCETHKCRVD